MKKLITHFKKNHLFNFKHFLAGFLFLSLFFNASIAYSQVGCCVCLRPGDFATACSANLDPCGTLCTQSFCDAQWGPMGILIGCDPTADCSTAGCAALPVEISLFYLDYSDEGIQLHWQTASENENEGFAIEFSMDGTNWKELDFVEGFGTTNLEQDYQYLHTSPKLGFNYYRLKQMDFNGTFSLTDIKSFFWQGEEKNIELVAVPNPANEWILLALPPQLKEKRSLTFEFYDSFGRLIRSETRSPEEEVRFDLYDLAPTQGVYYVRVAQDGKIYHSRFQKL